MKIYIVAEDIFTPEGYPDVAGVFSTLEKAKAFYKFRAPKFKPVFKSQTYNHYAEIEEYDLDVPPELWGKQGNICSNFEPYDYPKGEKL